MASLFLWKEIDELNYHRIHTQYLLELFKYVQNKPLVIYVDTNDINLQNGIDYYNGKHINIQDFYKKLEPDEYKNRIYNSETEYDQGFFSINDITENIQEHPFNLYFSGYNFSAKPNHAIHYEGSITTYLSYLKQLSKYGEIYPPEKCIYTFDDIPRMSLNFRCDNPFWYLEYYSLFNVYFMENPFITDTIIYINNIEEAERI
jgi:hypothetical protein